MALTNWSPLTWIPNTPLGVALPDAATVLLSEVALPLALSATLLPSVDAMLAVALAPLASFPPPHAASMDSSAHTAPPWNTCLIMISPST
jgi:hypothetical protein